MAKKEERVPSAAEIQSIIEGFLTKGMTVKDLKKITDQEMEAIYSVGYNYYRHGKYKEAKSIFSLLCKYDQYEPKYWIGVGSTQQMLKNYKQAIDAYSFAVMLNPLDPKVHRYVTDCFLALKDYEKAQGSLESLIMVCEDDEGLKEVKKEAENFLAEIKTLTSKTPKKKGAPKASKKKKGGKK